MQFISKEHSNNGVSGRSIVDAFISSCWKPNRGKYKNLKYSHLRQNTTFVNYLLAEQRGFCCYCMRQIPSDALTIEHAIPQNIKNDLANQLIFYAKYISPTNVIYQPVINQRVQLKCPPYPHCIAYENLTASCDGSIYDGGEEYILHGCCNNKRGNDKIIPLFFLPRIHHILIYEEDGRLTYSDEYDTTIKSLNLDCDSLRAIRKVWARIRNNKISILEVENAEGDLELRKDIVVQLDLEQSEEKDIKHDRYWKLLIQFKWFYGYFGLKYLN